MENTIKVKFKKGDKVYTINGVEPDIIDITRIDISYAGEEKQSERITGISRTSNKEVQFSNNKALFYSKNELLNEIEKWINKLDNK